MPLSPQPEGINLSWEALPKRSSRASRGTDIADEGEQGSIAADLVSVTSDMSVQSAIDKGTKKRKAIRKIESDEEEEVEGISTDVDASSFLAGLSAFALGVEIVQGVNRIHNNLRKSPNIQGRLKG